MYIAVFKSLSYANRMQNRFQPHKAPEIIKTPKKVAGGCSYSIVFDNDKMADVKKYIMKNQKGFLGIYEEISFGNYKKMDWGGFVIYLDNSATSDYKPKEVKKAVINALSNPVNVGRTANKKAFLYSRKIYETRERICNFIGGEEPESVIFTNNATTALNFAIKGILKNENYKIYLKIC